MTQEQSETFIRKYALAVDKDSVKILRDYYHEISGTYISSCFCNKNKINSFKELVTSWYEKQEIEDDKG